MTFLLARLRDQREQVKAGVCFGLVVFATIVFQIPVPYAAAPDLEGYFHLGDAAVFFSGLALGGPLGGLVAGLGSAVADVVSGAWYFAPLSFVAKAAMAAATGVAVDRERPGVLGMAVGALFMVVIYAFGEVIFLGGVQQASAELPLNVVQACVGGLIAVLSYRCYRSQFSRRTTAAHGRLTRRPLSRTQLLVLLSSPFLLTAFEKLTPLKLLSVFTDNLDVEVFALSGETLLIRAPVYVRLAATLSVYAIAVLIAYLLLLRLLSGLLDAQRLLPESTSIWALFLFSMLYAGVCTSVLSPVKDNVANHVRLARQQRYTQVRYTWRMSEGTALLEEVMTK